MNARRSHFFFVLGLLLGLAAGRAGAVGLELENGWTTAPGAGVPEVFLSEGVVHFKGAIQGGADNLVFALPASMRPSTRVHLSADLCGGQPGQLVIETTGEVRVYDTHGFVDAPCRTSLDGVRFVASSSGFTPLALQNGWSGEAFGGDAASAGIIGGIVHLKGTVSGGTAITLFTLPASMRPTANVSLRVDLCGAGTGRLLIAPSGDTTIVANGSFSEAQCFTSLEGASFVLSGSGFSALSVLNGWRDAPNGSTGAAVSLAADGIVRFKGALGNGTQQPLFRLPTQMIPSTQIRIPIDVCFSYPGELTVDALGDVYVEVPSPFSFSLTQCRTSLDGVGFVLEQTGFRSVRAGGGWFVLPFFTRGFPEAARYDGVVHLRGMLSSDSPFPTLLELPVMVRPETDVHLLVGLCGDVTGRVTIGPDGRATVFSTTTFSDAQCWVALEGISYVPSALGFTPLTLENGWVGGPISTSQPAAAIVDGMVHLKGALAGGADELAFTLPRAMRPAADVHLPIGLVDGRKGRLRIRPDGTAFISALADFSDAQQFASIDGVQFAPASNTSFAPLNPLNGWSPSGLTGSPAVTIVRDVVHLKGGVVTEGTSTLAFNLPPGLRPLGDRYLATELCNGDQGYLRVTAAGNLSIVGVDPNATLPSCFASLDGASYTVPEPSMGSIFGSGLLLLFGLRRKSLKTD